MSSIIRDSKSVVCGALFAAIGAGAFIAALSYPFGSAQRMGPGFFPMMLSGLLALLGILNILRGMSVKTVGRVRFGRIAWRPLVWITIGVLGFAVVLPRLGLLVSVAFLIGCASLAQERFRVVEMLCIALALVLLSTVLFVYGLDLPLAELLPH
ncbi:Tripartite tricarboxylate transporter TctB family [Burkholderia sp. Ch1-1]|nr:Tripartite tricarboxylate transporter TctB family [Burkholderia sp. Ch1-1]